MATHGNADAMTLAVRPLGPAARRWWEAIVSGEVRTALCGWRSCHPWGCLLHADAESVLQLVKGGQTALLERFVPNLAQYISHDSAVHAETLFRTSERGSFRFVTHHSLLSQGTGGDSEVAASGCQAQQGPRLGDRQVRRSEPRLDGTGSINELELRSGLRDVAVGRLDPGGFR